VDGRTFETHFTGLLMETVWLAVQRQYQEQIKSAKSLIQKLQVWAHSHVYQ